MPNEDRTKIFDCDCFAGSIQQIILSFFGSCPIKIQGCKYYLL
ncbi:MAG: hypothetical protein RLZZ262_1603 [Bacteroidota bacterium]|jgi:hypothetical protein